MIELYYLEEADSICSNRPRMTFVEKDINDWVPHRMSLMNRDQFKPEYLRLNPKAQVPTLVHDGRVIRESSIICDYIDDLKTEPALKPEDKAEAAHMREWIKEMDESGYQATAALNFVTKFRLTQDIKKMEERWKQVVDLDRLHRQQSCIREGMDSLYVVRAIAFFDRILGKIDATMADGRQWVMGESVSLVETNYAPFIKVVELLRLIHLFLEGRPHASAWWERLTSRPSYAILDDYPGQREDDEQVHAVSGAQVADRVAEIIQETRSRVAGGQGRGQN